MSIDSERDWTASSSTLKVGVGFSNRFELHENLANAAESISKVIGSASDLWPIPLIHVRHFKNMEERDDLGFYKALTALGLGESSEFYRQSLAEEWWNMNASGAIVNAQIDECHLVLTDRKHLMIRAAARGIPVICVTTGKQQSLKYLRGAMGSDAYKLVTIIQV
jgi:polysaccharide pyruvyl transferase WcaK-like protein